jgi:hypothetical protein
MNAKLEVDVKGDGVETLFLLCAYLRGAVTQIGTG